jgi:rare lipoprotein A (peptidoglycan hydrolase)
MHLLPRLIVIAAVPAWLGISANAAVAQDFNDRWSIIPKAHAEPAPEPPTETSPAPPPVVTPPPSSPEAPSPRQSFNRVFSGKASFYSYSKGKTASGAKFDRDAMTAAHRSLPFGTKVRVTDISSSKSVIVHISDRGPFIAGRVLDLSLAAARTLGITDRGVAQVRVEVL